MGLEGGAQQDDVSVCEPVGEVKFVVASENNVEVETFDRCVREVPHETRVGRVVYLLAQFLVLLQHRASHTRDLSHL